MMQNKVGQHVEHVNALESPHHECISVLEHLWDVWVLLMGFGLCQSVVSGMLGKLKSTGHNASLH